MADNPKTPKETLPSIPNPLKIEWINQPKKKWWFYLWDISALLIPIFGALVGYYLVNKWGQQREQAAKLSATKIQYSIDAFTDLSKAFVLNIQQGGGQEEFQKAFSKVQLFGTSAQIGMAKGLMETINAKKPVNFNPLLLSLRDDLRAELEMESDTTKMYILLQGMTGNKPNLSRGLYVQCPKTGQYLNLMLGYSLADADFDGSKIYCAACKENHKFDSKDVIKVP